MATARAIRITKRLRINFLPATNNITAAHGQASEIAKQRGRCKVTQSARLASAGFATLDTAAMPKTTFTLNGKPNTASYEPGMNFLEVLREDCGLTSPKNGCAPEGVCGCCAVLID